MSHQRVIRVIRESSAMSSGKPLMFSTEYKSSNIMDFLHIWTFSDPMYFVWTFHSLWTFFSMDIIPYGHFTLWTICRFTPKNRVIVIQKENRKPGLFSFGITMSLIFCTLIFFDLIFFLGHKPTHVFKTRIVGAD
jgi:hypothetical protein